MAAFGKVKRSADDKGDDDSSAVVNWANEEWTKMDKNGDGVIQPEEFDDSLKKWNGITNLIFWIVFYVQSNTIYVSKVLINENFPCTNLKDWFIMFNFDVWEN